MSFQNAFVQLVAYLSGLRAMLSAERCSGRTPHPVLSPLHAMLGLIRAGIRSGGYKKMSLVVCPCTFSFLYLLFSSLGEF